MLLNYVIVNMFKGRYDYKDSAKRVSIDRNQKNKPNRNREVK